MHFEKKNNNNNKKTTTTNKPYLCKLIFRAYIMFQISQLILFLSFRQAFLVKINFRI